MGMKWKRWLCAALVLIITVGLVPCSTGGVLAAEVDKFDFAGSTMTLGNTLEINFVIDNANIQGEGNYVVITKQYADDRGLVSKTIPQNQWKNFSSSRKYVSFTVSAKEMKDQLTATVYNADGQQISNVYYDSVADYCVRMLTNRAQDASVTELGLYVDMLGYGAAAQAEWDYNAENPANAALTDLQKNYATIAGQGSNILVKGIGYAGSTLSLKENILLNIVFYNTTIDNAAYALVSYTGYKGAQNSYRVEKENFQRLNSAMKYVQVDTLKVADYAQAVTVQLYDEQDNMLSTVVESIESYISRNPKALHQATLAFCKGAYKYLTSELEILPVGEVVSTFQEGHGWKAVTLGDYTATIAADTQDYLLGTQSVRFTNCIQGDNLGLDIEGKHIRVRFRINAIDAGANLTMYVADSANFGQFVAFDLFNTSQQESHRVAKVGEWTDMIIPWAGSEAAKNPEFYTVNTLRFKFAGGAGDANIQLVALEDIPAEEKKGIVSFTFDDGLVTQYTEAADILAERGIRATAYIIPSLVGVSQECMTEEQIVSLKNDYGWDIQCHGESRLDEMTDAEIIADFTFTKRWIQERGLGNGDHYAYPNGVFDGRIKELAQKYFTSARTIDYSTLNGYDSTLLPEPYNIRAFSNIGEHSLLSAKRKINRVAQSGGWVVLVFHSIGDVQSGMYCSADVLAEIADYAVSRGVEIKTVAEVLQ